MSLLRSTLPDRWQTRTVALLVVAFLGACGFHLRDAPDPVQQAALDSSVVRIQELEREVVGDVAFMRVGDKRSTRIRENIEDLGRGVLELKRLMEQHYPAVVVDSTDLFESLYARVESEERAVSSLMLHLEFMLERLNRIPETVGALERAAPYVWADPELTAALSSILRDLFVSAARNVASADHWFEEDLERMRNLRDLATSDLAPVIDRLVSYCESLTKRARLVDTGLRELETLPVGHAVADLREACLQDFVSRQRGARTWRWTLLLALACGMVLLGFQILVLSKSNQLDQTESELLTSQLRSKDELNEDLGLRIGDERARAERAEASYRRARLQEDAALRVKAEFLAFLDQRVRGRVDDLLSEATQASPSKESQLAIPRHAQVLRDTLSDLFDMERCGADELEIQRTPCVLDDLLSKVEEHGRDLARNKAVTLSIQRAEGTPDTIHTDPDRVRRVLQNLLEHAIVSTDRGEVELRVDPSIGTVEALQFTVRDTGRGMNSDRIDFLFTPPQAGERIEGRAEALATPGLSIVATLVKKLGGAFHVDSVVGRGTTVTFDIDVSEPDVRLATVGERPARPKAEAARASANVRTARPLAGRRILVAEDGDDNRRLMEHVLERAGADVDMAENGEMAYEDVMAAEENGEPYDVVLMDMNMPVMDGYQATEALRADGYTRPIVALTASALPENRDRCLEAGCDEFLTKPVDAKVFAHQLEEIAYARLGPAASIESDADQVPVPALTPAAGPRAVRPSTPDEESPLLSAYAGDDDMGELIDLFVKDLKGDIRRINTALVEGDLESLGVLAHQLKGSAGSYGFPQLTVQADRLESCVRTGVDPDRLEQEVRDFVQLCKRISA